MKLMRNLGAATLPVAICVTLVPPALGAEVGPLSGEESESEYDDSRFCRISYTDEELDYIRKLDDYDAEEVRAAEDYDREIKIAAYEGAYPEFRAIGDRYLQDQGVQRLMALHVRDSQPGLTSEERLEILDELMDRPELGDAAAAAAQRDPSVQGLAEVREPLRAYLFERRSLEQSRLGARSTFGREGWRQDRTIVKPFSLWSVDGISPRLAELFGLSPEERAAKEFEWLEIAPERAGKVADSFQQAVLARPDISAEARSDYLQHANAYLRAFSAADTACRNGGGVSVPFPTVYTLPPVERPELKPTKPAADEEAQPYRAATDAQAGSSTYAGRVAAVVAASLAVLGLFGALLHASGLLTS